MTIRHRKRILLVEDDSDLATLYRGVLRMAGFECLCASDGWNALRMVDDERPDLVVLDIHLPGLRGDEILREMASRDETRDIPVVVVTGSDIALAVRQAKQILRKPCPPERLLSVVEQFVESAA
jgi:DNA-binding response OmpR family regulator